MSNFPFRSASVLLAALAATAASTAGRVHAQEARSKDALGFGARGPNVIVVDDLVGAYRETGYPADPPSSETGVVEVGSRSGVYSLNQTTRLGFHRFFGVVSIGTGLHYTANDTSSGLTHPTKVYGVSPRIGFVVLATAAGALWLRLGVQYYHYAFQGYSEDDFPSSSSGWDFGPGVEIFYVWTPHEHFGVTIGPMLELQLAGSIETASTPTVSSGVAPPFRAQGTERSFRRRTFGLAVGFLFDF